MIETANISVIIVSRDRPDDLQKMLACLRFQDISGFETIVVTDTPDAPNPDLIPENLRVIPFDLENISAARNVGIQASKGDFIAFCDDDALPDPNWLRLLLAPFSNPDIGGAGGFTRGRNGISLQWGAVITDLAGDVENVEISETTIYAPQKTTAPVLIGTNCAFRKTALTQIAGFDENFAYYLDDSDISLRLSQAGWHLAIVPDAQVHHGFSSSAQRTKHRIPKSLEQIGKSKAYFCRKHARGTVNDQALRDFELLHRRRLEKLMLSGYLEPAGIAPILQSLNIGMLKGNALTLPEQKADVKPSISVRPEIRQKTNRHVILAGGRKNSKWLKKTAGLLSKRGILVTTICLGYSAMYMQVLFSQNGFWQHSGGRFGKADRDDPIWRWYRKTARFMAEIRRLSVYRPVDILVFPRARDFDASLSPQRSGMTDQNNYTILDDSMLDNFLDNLK
ncbi:MAG: glycosyltransferase [Rhodobacteraceae bacterium]|nr:glycosyltransferase [Paracoccaceae bacterium]